jgi:hypothetical protein
MQEDNEAQEDGALAADDMVPEIGQHTRSFISIPDIYQPFTKVAEKVVANYTLFKKPLLTPGELHQLVREAWDMAQSESRYLERTNVVERYVCWPTYTLICWSADIP